jgi:hypothetical protein
LSVGTLSGIPQSARVWIASPLQSPSAMTVQTRLSCAGSRPSSNPHHCVSSASSHVVVSVSG